MENTKLKTYWLIALAAMLAVSFYPLYMGVRVVSDMITSGTVMKENYPKYIIPYTPIAVAVIIALLLLPLFLRWLQRGAFPASAALSIGVFFALEVLFEKKVVVTAEETVTKLEDWQMFMCYQPPGGWGTTVTTYKTLTPVEILIGEYDPAFKLHFYIISIVIILSLLNALYGFGQMVTTGDRSRRKALTLQSVAAVVFLGLCILACFTAFWRDGSLEISPLSASLMTLFFILLGVTVGSFVGSFLLGKKNAVSCLIPAVVAALTTLLMYIGEMILLSGHLYAFGTGLLFNSLPGIVLAPVDILVILASGVITYLLMKAIQKE